jgi:hypothetical protein
MRNVLIVVGMMVVAGCNNGGSSGSAASTSGGGGASSADCVTKLMAQNPGSGDPEKKLFTAMCDGLTGDQRSCIVNAKTKDDQDKCVAGMKLK